MRLHRNLLGRRRLVAAVLVAGRLARGLAGRLRVGRETGRRRRRPRLLAARREGGSRRRVAAVLRVGRALAEVLLGLRRRGVLLGTLAGLAVVAAVLRVLVDRKSTRLNSSHVKNSYAV